MANTIKCRHITDDEKKLFNDLKVDVSADNNSDALKQLLAAYKERPEMVLNASDEPAF